jgi:hypothetical protein
VPTSVAQHAVMTQVLVSPVDSFHVPVEFNNQKMILGIFAHLYGLLTDMNSF